MKTNYISKFFLSTIISGTLFLCLAGLSATQAFAQNPTLTEGGNQTRCSDFGLTGFKVEPIRGNSNHTLPNTNGNSVSITVTSYKDGEAVEFTFQTTGTLVSKTLAKGGTAVNVYSYNPGVTSGGPLVAPGNKGLSHIEFCYETVAAGPTAATAMIAGRVTTDTGFVRGSGRLLVTVLNTRTLETQVVFSNRLGYYEFNDLPIGDTYVISVRGKGYSFTPQIISLIDDSAVDMVGSSVGRSLP